MAFNDMAANPMTPPPAFLDAEHRELAKFQERAGLDSLRALVRQVVG